MPFLPLSMTTQVTALKNGNLDCFRTIYAQHHAKLYHYIYNRTQSEYMAQEVVQLSFIKLWESRHKLAEELTVDIQLFRIAKTILIDELRKDTVKAKYKDWAKHTTDCTYEDNQAADKDTLRYVFTAMENLPPIRKKVFKLSRVHGYSYKEIAGLLAISPKTVENHIAKAIKQLRSAISVFLF